MTEIWIDIKNYQGLYQTSNLGRARSLDRLVKGRNGFSKSGICQCCRGDIKYHKDCIWRYKNEEDN